MKKITWLLIITLLLGCLAACQSTGTQAYGDELTQSQKEEIESHFQKSLVRSGDRGKMMDTVPTIDIMVLTVAMSFFSMAETNF